MQNRIVAKACDRLGVALLAFGGLIGTALAEPASSTTPLTLSELQDGSLIAYPSGTGVVAGTRYTRQRKLAASRCVTLGTQRQSARDVAPVLVNHCDYAVTVSYCIDDREAAAHACQAAGHRMPDTQLIQPRASLPIDAMIATLLDDKINWVACRSAPGVLSTLTGGAHGECLMQDTSLARAQTAADIGR